MNSPTFLGPKVGEDPQAFFYEVYNIVYSMWVTSKEKAELGSYEF